MLTKQVPVSCTSSFALPIADLVIGAAVGAATFGTVYAAIEEVNEECSGGQCYRPWGPALIAAFLMVSPWWVSSAVGFSDTHQCRKAVEGATPPADSWLRENFDKSRAAMIR